jgi:hypothetical protein
MTLPYFQRLYDWLRDDGGYEIVTHYLATLPLQADLDPAQGLQRAPATTSIAEAIVESRGVIEQEIQDAVDAGLQGFRGGVITSLAARGLLDRLRRNVGPRTLNKIMTGMGYATHPALKAQKGRPNNALYDGSKPVLYYAKGHPLLSMRSYMEVILATEEILKNGEPASNVVPIRSR